MFLAAPMATRTITVYVLDYSLNSQQIGRIYICYEQDMWCKRVRGIVRGRRPLPEFFALNVFVLNLNFNSTSCWNWGGRGKVISYSFKRISIFTSAQNSQTLWRCWFNRKWFCKGWGLSVKLGKHSAIWGKLGTALQAYALNPCTKFPPNPTSRKVNT